MDHVYKKNDKFEREFVSRGVYTTEQHRCLRCGCIREKTEGRIRRRKYVAYSYRRNGILFSSRNGEPDCVDYQKEKQNYID